MCKCVLPLAFCIIINNGVGDKLDICSLPIKLLCPLAVCLCASPQATAVHTDSYRLLSLLPSSLGIPSTLILDSGVAWTLDRWGRCAFPAATLTCSPFILFTLARVRKQSVWVLEDVYL